MTDERATRTTAEGAAPRTRDWVWALAVVVGTVVLLTALLAWILVGSTSCGTRPAPGYGEPAACEAVMDSRPVTGARPATLPQAYRAETAPGVP